jgi:hypothetical protein
VTGKSRRIYALWLGGIGLLAVAGLLCWTMVLPVMEVRRELPGVHSVTMAPVVQDEAQMRQTFGAAVERLGGRDQAIFKVKMYLRMPARVAPAQHLALFLLGQCGEPAVDVLCDSLWPRYDAGGMDSEIAAYALGEIGPAAQRAVPELVRLGVALGYDRPFSDALKKIDPMTLHFWGV